MGGSGKTYQRSVDILTGIKSFLVALQSTGTSTGSKTKEGLWR
jgi:hypothetical protein